MALDLTELPTAIRKAWDAVVPPVTELAVFAAISIYLIGWRSANEALVSTFTPEKLLPPERIRPVLDFYGLASLIPFAIVIAILVLAHAVGRFVRWAGGLMPGHLSTNTTEQIYGALEERGLRRIWACHPDLDDVNGLNTLNIIIDEEVSRAAADPKGHHRLKNVAEARQWASRYRERIDFAKGLLLVAVLWWSLMPFVIDGATRSPGRLCVVLALLIAWILWSSTSHISAEQELAQQKVHAYLEAKASRLKGGGEPRPEDWERDRERITMLKNAQLTGAAWSFHLLRPRSRTSAARQLHLALWRFVTRHLPHKWRSLHRKGSGYLED